MKLSIRLQELANYINKGEVVADVGSDHAFLPIYLIKNNIIEKAYAIENKRGPYNIMESHIKENNVNVVPMFSDGIKDLPSDVNTVVIAGMGAGLILEILSNKEKLSNVNALVIDSHNDIPRLRKDIVKLGFVIKNESLIIDKKKYYTIIRFEKGIGTYTEKEYYFGPILLNNKTDLFYKYHKDRLEVINRLLTIENIDKEELLKEKKLIEEVLL